MIISMGRFFLIRIQKKPLIKFDNHLGDLPVKKSRGRGVMARIDNENEL